MSSLKSLNKYFWKYKWLFLLGIIFIVFSNYFRILSPQLTKYVLNTIEHNMNGHVTNPDIRTKYDPLIQQQFINSIEKRNPSIKERVLMSGLLLLVLALISGFFMFLMRQTIIVMSRHIEFDQKNEVFAHYQLLDTNFYKTHSTGDLMSRISEDVSRVRMYTGPAVMYLFNLAATISFSVYYMWNENHQLTLYVLSPLPILAFTIYLVNTIINKKSDKIQSLLSDLTTNAQQSYSGIRVIKSFGQEKSMLGYFIKNSELYRKSAISLAKTEAIYFPSMSLLIGLSTLMTIMIGGLEVIGGRLNIGVIGEFVMYILMLTFPVSAIGWTASMIQRASTSQRRINEFLNTAPTIKEPDVPLNPTFKGDIEFINVDFTYPHTGIRGIWNFNLKISKGQKIAIVGKTGSGKTTLAQLLLRMYDPQKGDILYNGVSIRNIDLHSLRSQVCYVPQDVFLFSDTVENNIRFGMPDGQLDNTNIGTRGYRQRVPENIIIKAAQQAVVANEIEQFSAGYQTMIGERGVTLSGGQKQRISIARALIKDHAIVVFDDCLSAVDARTEHEIILNLYEYLEGKTAIIITHRIFSLLEFDKIILLQDGMIVEAGTHSELLQKNGSYAGMYRQQQQRLRESN